MGKTSVKVLGICLLISITFSLSLPRGQGQQRTPPKPSEITFVGKEETRWTEKREIPIPVMIGQGIKEEPRVDSFDLREDSIGPMRKMSPSSSQPGCVYTSRLTRGVTKVLVGGKAFYEQGRSQYFEGDYEDAIQSFRKLTQSYPKSEWAGSAFYWMGEAKFRQGKEGEAFLHFSKMVG